MSTVSRVTSYRIGTFAGRATLTYDTARPLEVSLSLGGKSGSGREVAWVFARDVLARRVPGRGDVACRANGMWLYLTLRNNNGSAEVRFVQAQVSAFLRATRRLVPFGDEQPEPEIGYDAEWELSLLGGER